jgi:hypothetical protein
LISRDSRRAPGIDAIASAAAPVSARGILKKSSVDCHGKYCFQTRKRLATWA